MTVKYAPISYHDLPAWRFSDDALEIVLIPAWGGKIASLVDKRCGREWLFANPHLPYRLPVYDANYVADFDVGGFDECFPNVGSGAYPSFPWQGTPLPDHGEVWALPWEFMPLDKGCTLAVHGIRLPYRLDKTLTFLGAGRLRFDYLLTNHAPFPMPFVWSSHPLFAVEPGMRIQLPAQQIRVEGATESFGVTAGETVSWPSFDGRDLSMMPSRDTGIAVKLYAQMADAGWVSLEDPKAGAAARFDFDPQLVTHVGLWLNWGGWAGVAGAAPYYNAGIEPCIGIADRLDIAVNEDGHGEVAARESRRWWLELTLS